MRQSSGADRTKPASIRTVATYAGVSTATVSNVLSGKTTVTQALADRVRAAVAELGYVADGAASRLRSGKLALAGVVVPDLGNPFFGAFVSRLEQTARKDGFDLLAVSSNDDPGEEAERLNQIRSWRPAGLIVLPCDGALAARRPKASHIPIVAVDRIPDMGGFDLVAVDNGAAASAVAAHCAAQGFASLLVVGSVLSLSNIRERWEGARGAAGAMRTEFLEAGIRSDAIRHRLRERFLHRPLPEVIFALDHMTSLATYTVLAELGLSIPGDVAFAGFDETEWMRLVRPGVTAVRQPVEAMAEAAWRRLMRRIAGDTAPVDTLRLACSLEIRGSTLRDRAPRATGAPHRFERTEAGRIAASR